MLVSVAAKRFARRFGFAGTQCDSCDLSGSLPNHNSTLLLKFTLQRNLIAPREVNAVSEYRAYTVGLEGHFLKSDGFECADDDSAVKHAQRLVESHDVELWCGNRLVAKLARSKK
jgi:hypothetical protein